MEFKSINNGEIEQFIFLYKNELPLYYSKGYLDFEKAIGNDSVLFYTNDNTTFICRIYKKLFFKFLQPYCPPYKNGKRLSPDDEKAFLENWVQHLKHSNSYHRVILSFTMDVFEAFPADSVHCPFGQVYLDLEKYTDEELFNRFTPRNKRYVRQIENMGADISIKMDKQQLDKIFSLYKDLHKKQNLYHDNYAYFSNMYDSLSPENCIAITVNYKQEIEGGVIIILNKKEAYFLYAGAITPTVLTGSLKYLYWEIIKLLRQRKVKKAVLGGFRLSDVSGTKLAGIQEFKTRIGAEVKKGYLWKIDINPLMAKSYDLLIWIQHKLKGQTVAGDVIDYEKDREVIL